MHTDTVSAHLHRLNWLLRARVVEAKLRELKRAVKAGFDPNQPRVPAGSGRPSGRWTDGGGGGGGDIGGSSQVAQNVPRGGGGGSYRLRSGRLVEPTPAQAARLVAVEAEAARLRRQVREIDPAWEPRESLTTPDSIEGDIAAARGEAREAQVRLRELAQQPAENLIEAYRQQQGLDLLGDPIWSREQNTVATCKVGDVPLIGTNSGSITYTQQDQATAEHWRDALLEGYPTVMNTRRIGGFPNNAVFHAEATCLLRAARANGGTLAGQTIEVQVDRAMCASCRTVLPYIGLELGNPTVVFTDPSGRVRIMRDGLWIK